MSKHGIKHKVDLEPVIDNLPVPIIVVDRDRRVLLGNIMAEMFAEKTKEEFFGLYGGEAFGCVNSKTDPMGCGFAPECEYCTVRNTVLDTFENRSDTSMVEAEMTFFGMGKKILRLSTTFLPLETQDVVILALEDITDLKAQGKIKMENEKLLAAMEISGGICHEMNQPLMAISGYIDLLLLNKEKTHEDHEALGAMRESMDRLAGITKKLMHLQSYQTKSYLLGSRILDIDRSAESPEERSAQIG